LRHEILCPQLAALPIRHQFGEIFGRLFGGSAKLNAPHFRGGNARCLPL
jgi:hypothetical protein